MLMLGLMALYAQPQLVMSFAEGNAVQGNSCALCDGSTSLLALSCYVFLLEIYEVQVASLDGAGGVGHA